MSESDIKFINKERFQGWSTRLLGCLSMQLCRAGILDARTKLLLHLVSHLELHPLSGKKIHVALIGRSLLKFLLSVDLNKAISSPFSEKLFTELTELNCYPCSASQLGNKGLLEGSLSSKEKVVFSSEYLLHEDCDGFAQTFFEGDRNMLFSDSFDLCEKTLTVMERLCPCPYSSELSFLEVIACALSIASRLKTKYQNDFEGVVQKFMEIVVPDLRYTNEFRNWFMLMLLTSRASKSMLFNDLTYEKIIEALSSYIQLAAHSAQCMITSLVNGLYVEFVCDAVMPQNESFFYYVLQEVFRQITDVLKVLDEYFSEKFFNSFRRNFVEDQLKIFGAHIFLCCERVGYVETVRSAFALIENLSLSCMTLCDNFYNYIIRIIKRVQAVERFYFLKMLKKLPAGNQSSLCAFKIGKKCSSFYLFSLCGYLLTDSSCSSGFNNVVKCIRNFPRGVCSCTRAVNIVETLLVKSAIISLSEDFYEAFSFHLRSFVPKRDVSFVSLEMQELFFKHFSSSNFLLVHYVLNLLSLCLPYCTDDSCFVILKAVISHCSEKNEYSVAGVTQRKSLCMTSCRSFFIEFLSDNVFCEAVMKLSFESIVLPALKTHQPFSDVFMYCMDLAKVISGSEEFASYKKDLIVSLIGYSKSKIEMSSHKFLEFLSFSDACQQLIAALHCLLICFATCNYENFDFTSKNETKSLCVSFIDLLTCDRSNVERVHCKYRFGQLAGLCLALVALVNGDSKMLETLGTQISSFLLEKGSLRLWKHTLCSIIEFSVVKAFSRGHMSRKFVNVKLCSLAFLLLQKAAHQMNFMEPDCYENFFISSVCTTVGAIYMTPKKRSEYFVFSKIVLYLNQLLVFLSKCECSVHCFKTALSVYLKFITTRSKPFELKPLLTIFFRVPRFQLQILEVFKRFVEENSNGPTGSLLFPQRALSNRFTCSQLVVCEKAEKKAMTVSQPAEVTALSLPRPSSFLTIFEKLSAFPFSEKVGIVQTDLSTSRTPNQELERTLFSSDVEEPQCAAEVALKGTTMMKLSDGFFVSFWVRLCANSAENCIDSNPLPICSFGSACLNLYLSVGSDLKTISVSAFSNKEKIYEAQKIHRSVLTSWTHITFAALENKGEYSFKVFLRDGHCLFFAGSFFLPGNANNIAFRFGALKEGDDTSLISYAISTVFGFKGVLDEKNSFVLYCFGSEICTLAETRTTKLQSLFHFPLGSSVAELASGNAATDIINSLSVILERLQLNLLFIIRSLSAASYSVYMSQSEVTVPAGFDIKGSSSVLQILNEHSILWNCEISLQQNITLQRCLYPLGSTRLLLYFLAYAVDSEANCEVQAAALGLLLAYVQKGCFVRTEFCSSSGYDVITRCFSSSLAKIGPATVSVIVKYSVTNYSLVMNNYLQEPHSMTVDAIIHDPELLIALICCADIWRGTTRTPYWVRLVKIISDCLSDVTCSFFKFNRVQLCRFQFPKLFFHTCQVMLQDKDSFWLSDDEACVAVSAITSIASALIESSQASNCVLLLWKFLFLSHPAVDTYINYKICGYVDWLKTDFMRDNRAAAKKGDSDLVERLREYLTCIGQERLAKVWAEKRSILVLKQLFESLKTERNLNEIGLEIERKEGGHNPAVSKKKLLEAREATEKRYDIDMKESDDIDIPATSWFEKIQIGFTNILSVLAQNGPDSLISLLHSQIGWQSIVVLLTNRGNMEFRNSIFFFLEHFMLRAPIKVKEQFLKGCGFGILANQLHGYAVTSQIADCLFSLCCSEPVRIEEGLDADHVRAISVDHFSCSSFDAIFVLWNESVSVSTTALFWNIAAAILKVFQSNSLLMQAMMDAQLCDVLVGVLRKIAALPIELTDVENVYACSPLFECWSSLVRQVIISCVPFSDTKHFEMCQRMVLLLECALLECVKTAHLTAEKKLRRGFCVTLTCWMKSLQNVYADIGPSVSTAPSVESLSITAATGSVEAFHSFGSVSSAIPKESTPMAAIVSGSLASLRRKFASLGDQMKCQYKWRDRHKILNSVEITDRLLFGLSAISHVFIIVHSSSNSVVSDEEEGLFQYFVSFLFSTWKTDCYANFSSNIWGTPIRSNAWTRILVSCRGRSKLIISQLLAFVVFPAEKKLTHEEFDFSNDDLTENVLMKRRLMIIRMFANDFLYRPLLKELLDINLDYQYTMNLALHELALVEENVDQCSLHDIEQLVKFLRNLQIESPFAKLTEERLLSLNYDEKLSVESYVEHKNAYLLTMRQKASAIFEDEQVYVEQVSQLAMTVTCTVVNEQNLLRKSFIEECRDVEVRMLVADKALAELALQLCHPEASCYDSFSWPLSWELDPTEGPSRERRRLVAAHLRLDKQFILPEFAYKLSNRDCPLPLSNLLSGRRTSTKGWSMLESLAPGERIKTVMEATVVRSTVESQGEILIGDKKFYFFSSATRTAQKGILQPAAVVLAWDYAQVVEVYKRHNLLKDRALEIFFSDGQTYLIAFEDCAKRNDFLDSLLAVNLPNLVSAPQNSLQSTTQLWREGNITNFEYLMQLNKLAGRTFNDLMQYPVFPFILSDYTSKKIDLADSSLYRNLAKPMAIQNKNMEEHYLRNYACLEQEASLSVKTTTTPATFGPYHYGSHYSNSGIVVHYLVRLPPFTEIALEYQDDNFDIPDRLFNSIETTWRLSSSDSTTDFKELIPEFFYCHEFLLNREGFKFGVRQNGVPVNDVILPKWCENSARLFIQVHRQALESLIVRSSLHYWIDLIFGYKQNGPAAVQAINVFHPATYRDGLSGIVFAEDDLISIGALETMVRTYGQMPTQLFLSPHLPDISSRNLQASAMKCSLSPLDTVLSLRWGEFVGSPDSEFGCPIAALEWRPSQEFGHISHVNALLNTSCYAFPNECLLLLWAKTFSQSKSAMTLGLLSWQYSDCLIRMCLLGPYPVVWMNIIDLCNFKMTAIAFSTTNGLLFLALAGGVTRVYRIFFGDSCSHGCVFLRELFAHDGDVTTISLCGEFAVAVTGCVRGKVCVWDINKLSYVRTLLSCPDSIVNGSCISPTTADVAVSLQSKLESSVMLFTINGELVGAVKVEVPITSMCMTTLPEGTAINCLVLGLQNGIIRFLNMWTMAPLRDILDQNYMEPVVSMAFAARCTKLYTCLASGTVVCWHGKAFNLKKSSFLHVISSSGICRRSFASNSK